MDGWGLGRSPRFGLYSAMGVVAMASVAGATAAAEECAENPLLVAAQFPSFDKVRSSAESSPARVVAPAVPMQIYALATSLHSHARVLAIVR